MTVTEPNITSPVEEAQPQKTSRWAAWRGMWFFPVAVLWMELVLRISTIGFDYPKGLLYTFGFSLAAGLLLALLGKAFSPKAGRIIVTALWGIFSIFYMGQVVYYAIFKLFYPVFGGRGRAGGTVCQRHLFHHITMLVGAAAYAGAHCAAPLAGQKANCLGP